MDSVLMNQGNLPDFLVASIFFIMLISSMVLWTQPSRSTLSTRRISEISAYIALFLGVLYAWQVLKSGGSNPQGWLYHGELQAILLPYMLLMGILVKRFSYSYLQSDASYNRFFMTLKWLVVSLALLITANHTLLQIIAWVASGWLMYCLLRHTQSDSAKQSARLSVETFMIGDFLFILAIMVLSFMFKSPFISDWGLNNVFTLSNSNQALIILALLIFTIGLFTKLSCLPFHTWLPQTLTAPTPVSAMMHAGFVNAGAIILTKMSHLIIQLPFLSYFLMIAGLLTALYGSVVMLVQTDVKRYLTYSTIGQMGFMVLECGLGAYHLAIAHLMIHGFFKARLFLSSGSVVAHRSAIRYAKSNQPKFTTLPQKLIHLLVLATTTSITWWAAHGISSIGFVLDHLPALLVVVIFAALIITQQTLFRIKGLSVWSVSMALMFGLALLIGYSYYEVWANSVLPHYNLTQHLQELPIYWVLLGGYLLTSLGVVLQHMGIGVLPNQWSRQLYMWLRAPKVMAFTHR